MASPSPTTEALPMIRRRGSRSPAGNSGSSPSRRQIPGSTGLPTGRGARAASGATGALGPDGRHRDQGEEEDG